MSTYGDHLGSHGDRGRPNPTGGSDRRTAAGSEAGDAGAGGWFGRRFDRDRSLGLRLTLATAAVFLVLVPFTLLAVLVQTSFGPLNDLDQGVARDLHTYAVAHPGWVTFLQAWTDVMSPGVWRVLVGLAMIWLLFRRAPRLALWAATTITVGGLLGVALKEVTARARPHLPDPVALAPGSSFPSGHALNATLGAGILVLLLLPLLKARWRTVAWVVAAVIALGVAYTRVALGVHWVSDVVAGIVLGVAVIAATTAAFETWRLRGPCSSTRRDVAAR
ncbi:phosphatase PAP2 family protein [Sphaerisporangium sp. NPDC051011]|uniref:phosphatase PAP2 family protein n=1 Tax=Sphaerisporangium sp. NPDC051011 TaxID=3155792 RepID=UPI0033C9A376